MLIVDLHKSCKIEVRLWLGIWRLRMAWHNIFVLPGYIAATPLVLVAVGNYKSETSSLKQNGYSHVQNTMVFTLVCLLKFSFIGKKHLSRGLVVIWPKVFTHMMPFCNSYFSIFELQGPSNLLITVAPVNYLVTVWKWISCII